MSSETPIVSSRLVVWAFSWLRFAIAIVSVTFVLEGLDADLISFLGAGVLVGLFVGKDD